MKLALLLVTLAAAGSALAVGPTDWEGTWQSTEAGGAFGAPTLFYICPGEEGTDLKIFSKFDPNGLKSGLPGLAVGDFQEDFVSAEGKYYYPGFPATPVGRVCLESKIAFAYVDEDTVSVQTWCNNDGHSDWATLKRVDAARPAVSQCAQLAEYEGGDAPLQGTFLSNFRTTGAKPNTIMTIGVDKMQGEFYRGESSSYVNLKKEGPSALNSYFTVKVAELGRVGTGIMYYQGNSISSRAQYWVLVYRLIDGQLGMLRYDFTDRAPVWVDESMDVYKGSLTPPQRDSNIELAPVGSGAYTNLGLFQNHFVCTSPIGVNDQTIFSSTYNLRGVMYGIKPLDEVAVYTGHFADLDTKCNSGEVEIVIPIDNSGSLIVFYKCDDDPEAPASVISETIVIRADMPSYLCARGVGYVGSFAGKSSTSTYVNATMDACADGTARSFKASYQINGDAGYAEGHTDETTAIGAGAFWQESGLAGRQVNAAYADDSFSALLNLWGLLDESGAETYNGFAVLKRDGPASEANCTANQDLKPLPTPSPSPLPSPSPSPVNSPAPAPVLSPTPVPFSFVNVTDPGSRLAASVLVLAAAFAALM